MTCAPSVHGVGASPTQRHRHSNTPRETAQEIAIVTSASSACNGAHSSIAGSHGIIVVGGAWPEAPRAPCARAEALDGRRGAQHLLDRLPAHDADRARAVQHLVGALDAHGHVAARHEQRRARLLEADGARLGVLGRARRLGRLRLRGAGVGVRRGGRARRLGRRDAARRVREVARLALGAHAAEAEHVDRLGRAQPLPRLVRGDLLQREPAAVSAVVEEGLEEELLQRLLRARCRRAARVVAIAELDLVDEPDGVQEAHADARAAVLLAHLRTGGRRGGASRQLRMRFLAGRGAAVQVEVEVEVEVVEEVVEAVEARARSARSSPS